MADETTQPTGETPSGQPDGAESQESSETPATNLSAEEVDAQWRNRMSQRDKAHAAELKALRDQQEASNRQLQTLQADREQQRLAGMSEAERVVAQNKQLQDELAAERLGRVADVRKAKYPNIAPDFEDSILASMDEGRLADLNARLATAQTTAPPSLIDPNSAARTSQASNGEPKAKSLADLQAEFRNTPYEAPG